MPMQFQFIWFSPFIFFQIISISQNGSLKSDKNDGKYSNHETKVQESLLAPSVSLLPFLGGALSGREAWAASAPSSRGGQFTQVRALCWEGLGAGGEGDNRGGRVNKQRPTSTEKSKLFKLLSHSASSLPTLPASFWWPPRTPPSTAPRQGLPPAASLEVPPALGSAVLAPGSQLVRVGCPGAAGARGCPALLRVPGTSRGPSTPALGSAEERKRRTEKQIGTVVSKDRIRGCVDVPFTTHQGCPLTGPPAGLGPSRGPGRPPSPPPGDRVWGSR